MFGRVCLVLVVGTLAGLTAGPVRAVGPQTPAAGRAEGASPAPAEQRAFLNQYCVTCHSQRLKTAGLSLETLDVGNVGGSAVVWEKVVRKMRGGLMPPVGRPRPEPSHYEGFVTWLETQLDTAAAARPHPGRKDTFHRLNRAEYHNAVRELLTVDPDVAELLPPDDASYGFDNIAGVLKVSQSLLERYLVAARKISRMAVGSPVAAPVSEMFRVPDELPQTDRVQGLPFGTRGGTLIRYSFPQDAQYDVTVEFGCSKVETVGCDAIGGFPDAHQLELTVDGERVKLFTLEPRRRTTSAGGAGTSEGVKMRIRIPVKGGPREVGLAFLKLPSVEEADGIRARFDKPMYLAPWISSDMSIYQPVIEKVTIGGPFEPTGGFSDTPSRRAIFSCRPAAAAEETACARTILTKLARRAYRRPVTAADVDGLLAFYRDGRKEGSFDAGVEMALRAMLVSPQFLFRVETDPAPVAPGSNYRVSDLELASRLSFFLWSSIPDDELLTVAAQGKLRNPAVLERQTRRMLADPRSGTLTSNFAVQWLQLGRLGTLQPSYQLYPDFDEGLRRAFVQETQLLFDSVLRENRSVMELLTANYTFVNERLARHYGIPNVRGSDFRRLALSEDSPHRGLLGQGSVLTLTSHAVRTSPVFRGKWILINVLGTPPPDPPANVPPLPEKKGDEAKVLTMRERMAEHRANPVCSTCHSVIDPLGFAFENFDPVGRWRTLDETSNPVDSSGRLPDGTTFQDFAGFRAGLLRHPERFVTTATEKLLTYAVGRGLQYYDMPTVRRIVRETAPSDYKLASIVLGVIKSDPFQMRRSASPAAEGVSAARN